MDSLLGKEKSLSHIYSLAKVKREGGKFRHEVETKMESPIKVDNDRKKLKDYV